MPLSTQVINLYQQAFKEIRRTTGGYRRWISGIQARREIDKRIQADLLWSAKREKTT